MNKTISNIGSEAELFLLIKSYFDDVTTNNRLNLDSDYLLYKMAGELSERIWSTMINNTVERLNEQKGT